jgi:hypothetical protein
MNFHQWISFSQQMVLPVQMNTASKFRTRYTAVETTSARCHDEVVNACQDRVFFFFLMYLGVVGRRKGVRGYVYVEYQEAEMHLSALTDKS